MKYSSDNILLHFFKIMNGKKAGSKGIVTIF